jgi:hypothetical protein
MGHSDSHKQGDICRRDYLDSVLDFFFSQLWAGPGVYVSLNGSPQQIHLLSFSVLKTVEMLRSS